MADLQHTSTSIGRDARLSTDVDMTSSSGRLGTAARTLALLPLLLPSAAGGHGFERLDQGTRVTTRADVRTLVAGTRLYDIEFEGELAPFVPLTRMARIKELAPLSLRDWAPVFGKSYTSIGHWMLKEPSRVEKLTRVLDALERAALHHSELKVWLTTPLVTTGVRPLDLLTNEHWRAFDGAVRVRAVARSDLAATELLRRRRAETTWALPEVPVSDSQA